MAYLDAFWHIDTFSISDREHREIFYSLIYVYVLTIRRSRQWFLALILMTYKIENLKSDLRRVGISWDHVQALAKHEKLLLQS